MGRSGESLAGLVFFSPLRSYPETSVWRSSWKTREPPLNQLLNLLTDVEGVSVGHATDLKLGSGATVIIFDEPAIASGTVLAGHWHPAITLRGPAREPAARCFWRCAALPTSTPQNPRSGT